MKIRIKLAVFVVVLSSCHKEEPDVIKLDYTKYYESAAYALASAKRNYTDALKSKDTTKIALAKKKLDAAQKSYGDSRKMIDQNSGAGKDEASATAKFGDDKVVLPPAPVPEKPKITTQENPTKEVNSHGVADRKDRRDSINRKRRENFEKFANKAKSDLQKDTVKNRLNRFGKNLQNFFKRKPAQK